MNQLIENVAPMQMGIVFIIVTLKEKRNLSQIRKAEITTMN